MTLWRPKAVMKKLTSMLLLRIGLVLPRKMHVHDINWFEKIKVDYVYSFVCLLT